MDQTSRTFLDFDALDEAFLIQYRRSFETAFPEIILHSEVVKQCWKKVETYFPGFQRVMVGPYADLIGYINTLPFHWDKSLQDLPDDGWDWLMQKGIRDHEEGLTPNCLGGLQVVISKHHLGKGLSKLFIAEGKRLQEDRGYRNFVLPIRPTFKPRHPNVNMQDYMHLKKDDKIYDPWIRTHLNSGAEIIKVCSNSMNVKGNVHFWETLMGRKITQSGTYAVEGALNLVSLDVEHNRGEYKEENIWIKYGQD